MEPSSHGFANGPRVEMPELVHVLRKLSDASQKTPVAKAVDEVVKEYTKKISELAYLTAELPKRLLMDNEQGLDPALSVLKCYSPSNQIIDDFLPGSETMPIAPACDDDVPEVSNALAKDEHPSDNRKSRSSRISRVSEADIAVAVGTASGPITYRSSLTKFEAKMREVMSKAHTTHSFDVSDFYRVMGSVCRCRCKRKRSYLTNLGEVGGIDAMKSALKDFRSGKFDLYVGGLIVANCLVMIVQSEYVGHQSEISLGYLTDTGEWRNATEYFNILEHFFNAMFLLELVLRFCIFGKAMLKDKTNWLDIVIVGGSSVQLYVLKPAGSEGINFSFFRMLRFVSFAALVWSMILLFIIMIMGGLFLSEVLKDYIADSGNPFETREWVYKYYGTSTRAMYSLFEVTFAGCWPNYFRPLIERVSGWYTAFAVFYISMVVFAIIRIITAIFLKETLMIASNDAEMMVQERLKQKEVYVQKLAHVFEAVDTSGDGKLSQDEFMQVVSNSAVRVWLQVLDLEVHDAQALFRLLDDGDGEITYDEFLRGVLRLKGQARTMDIVTIMHSNEKTLEAIKVLRTQVSELRNCFYPGDGTPREALPGSPLHTYLGRQVANPISDVEV